MLGGRFDKVLLALFIVWATDSAASPDRDEFCKHKLAPRVSPNKSIEGFVGGILGAVLDNSDFHVSGQHSCSSYGIYRMSLFCCLLRRSVCDLIESYETPFR